LAREVRQILIGQKHAVASKPTISTVFEEENLKNARKSPLPPTVTDNSIRSISPKEQGNSQNNPCLFPGIEDAAKASRQKVLRMKRLSEINSEISGTTKSSTAERGAPLFRKKLRWHALVDSGMGRLGFTTREVGEASSRSDSSFESEPKEDDGSDVSSISSSLPRDTIEIIQELYDAEVHEGAPIGE